MYRAVSKTIRAQHTTGVETYVYFLEEEWDALDLHVNLRPFVLRSGLESCSWKPVESREINDIKEIPTCEGIQFKDQQLTVLTYGKKKYVLEESQLYNISPIHLLTKPKWIFSLRQLKAAQAEGRLEALLMSPELIKGSGRRGNEYDEKVFSEIVDRIPSEDCKGLVRLQSGRLYGYRVDSMGALKTPPRDQDIRLIDKDTLDPIILNQRGEVKYTVEAGTSRQKTLKGSSATVSLASG